MEEREKSAEKLKKQYKRQNDFIKNHYERQTVTLPAGTRERIKKAGFPSVNGFINQLVADALRDMEK